MKPVDSITPRKKLILHANYTSDFDLEKPSRWRSFWWMLFGRCKFCGGELLVWSSNKAYCAQCEKLN